MKNLRFSTTLVVFLILTACTGQDSRVAPEEFLPASISSLGMTRSSDLLIFKGDSLSYYTNDAAFYQRFNFVEMATTDYTRDDIISEVEIFRFASPEDAYGLYSHLRYGNSDKVMPLAIEGFKSPPDIAFVKGPYVVHVMGFDDSEVPMQAISDLAAYYADDMPGAMTMPERFAMFPSEGRMNSTAMYFPNQFLGIDFMKCVYSCYQVIDTDTVFIFMACDSAGPKLLQWSKISEADSTYRPAPENLPFEEGKGFMIEHARFGRIVAGIRNDIMVAMIGYEDRHQKFMADWVNSLPERAI